MSIGFIRVSELEQEPAGSGLLICRSQYGSLSQNYCKVGAIARARIDKSQLWLEKAQMPLDPTQICKIKSKSTLRIRFPGLLLNYSRNPWGWSLFFSSVEQRLCQIWPALIKWRVPGQPWWSEGSLLIHHMHHWLMREFLRKILKYAWVFIWKCLG